MVCTMEIVHTMASEAIAKHPERRAYSCELKSQVVAVHRWLREHARGTLPVAQQGFVAPPLPMPALDAAKPASVPAEADGDIRIEVRRGAGSVTVNWPLQRAASCAAWLRELLR